jgi:hypothetical protein
VYYFTNGLTDFVNFEKSLYLPPTLLVRCGFRIKTADSAKTNRTGAGRISGNQMTDIHRKLIE